MDYMVIDPDEMAEYEEVFFPEPPAEAEDYPVD